MRQNRMAELLRACGWMTRELEVWLEARENKSVRLRYKPVEQARLLRLSCWCQRLHISVMEALDLLLPILRRKIRRKKKSWALGVSLRALCGDAAREILEDRIAYHYPNGEHKTIWREREREKQLRLEKEEELEGFKAKEPQPISLLSCETAEDFITQYSKRVLAKRHENQKAVLEAWRKRKAYRGNPWI